MEDKYKIPYINACIRAFAKRFNLSAKAAYEYLDQYKGLDFWLSSTRLNTFSQLTMLLTI